MVEPAAVPVVRAALIAQAAQLLPLLLGVRGDDAALAGRHLLVRIEREHGGRPMPPERPATVFRPERLARVFDQRQSVALGDRADRIELTREAEHVDGHDRAGPLGHRGLDR